MWVILVSAVSPLLLPKNKMLLSRGRSFCKAYRCHLAAHAEEGKKPVFIGVVIHVRKGIHNVAGWSCSLEVPPCNEGHLSSFLQRNLFGLKPSLGLINGGWSAVISRSLLHKQFMSKNGEDLPPHPTGVEAQTHGTEMADIRAQNVWMMELSFSSRAAGKP